MNKFNYIGIVAGVLLSGYAMAAEWAPITQGESTVREVDTSSIVQKGAVATFVARHTFADKEDYIVGRREVKFLQIVTRANCDSRTMAQLATEAYDKNMGLIGKQQIQLPQDNPVLQGSIDESVLNFICATGRPLQKQP